ncbi:hypothetical protein BO70DRAFT_354866 [Aspergillus heteromorphus CBS 117.55]|uniref:Thioesterase domain-containing protein n=1 Tax=Aspergillus heteromorphus CBS 117.55 TaxID=1448321 RepID=A0A317VGY1_9EURO|nr:uncharacterized protein BO70DRAFT_354866 [Aspergillus heteromorphus CBS 117.55]PWY73624.1 hypothetical protein BO70DRAFT_354866 [Aspergillus heteromorphus CBS 117.55]
MPPSSTTRPVSDLSDFERRILDFATGPQPTHSEGELWSFSPSASNVRLESATQGPPARVSYLLTVLPQHCNFMGSLHGGCAATIIDVLSSMLVLGLSSPGRYSLGGVSRNLKLTYLRPVPVGSEIRLSTGS